MREQGVNLAQEKAEAMVMQESPRRMCARTLLATPFTSNGDSIRRRSLAHSLTRSRDKRELGEAARRIEGYF